MNNTPNIHTQNLTPTPENVSVSPSVDTTSNERQGKAQQIATADERTRYVSSVVSVVVTVILATLLLSLVSELFERTFLRAALVLMFTLLIWSGALNGMLQMGRHAHPPQLGKKWIDISYGMSVIAAGIGLFVRDAIPHAAIGLSRGRLIWAQQNAAKKAATEKQAVDPQDASTPAAEKSTLSSQAGKTAAEIQADANAANAEPV